MHMWDPFSLSLALEKKGSLLDYVGIFVALKPLYVLSFYCSSPRHPPTPSHVTSGYDTDFEGREEKERDG